MCEAKQIKKRKSDQVTPGDSVAPSFDDPVTFFTPHQVSGVRYDSPPLPPCLPEDNTEYWQLLAITPPFRDRESQLAATAASAQKHAGHLTRSI